MQVLLKVTLRYRAQWHSCGSEAASLVQALPSALLFSLLSGVQVCIQLA